MKVNYYKFPCEHIIVEDMYSSNELTKIWRELDFLTSDQRLNVENTSSATDFEGNKLKSNYGVFLEEFYRDIRHSDIINIVNSKITVDLLDNFSYNQIFKKVNFFSSLLSYYESGDEYKFHFDESIITMTSYFFREPKNFIGGDFFLIDKNYKIEVKNNMTILFPSFNNHAVSHVEMNKTEKMSGLGRYCVSTFLYTVPSQFKNLTIV
jgi:Rps23 Pro-64 3,4-dihydroxylase Tpa1-like proline 4-hydroxylase